jgi:hypothetical protein
MLPPMKISEFRTALAAVGWVALALGVAAFFVGLGPDPLIAPGARALATFLLPHGSGGVLLWLHAGAVSGDSERSEASPPD